MVSFFLMWVVGLAYFFRDFLIVSPSNSVVNETVSAKAIAPASKKIELDIATHLSSGRVTIQDKWGGQISGMPVAVLDKSIVALPVNATIGGYTWLLESDAHKKSIIDRGFWKKADTVGLWFLEKNEQTLDDIALATWKQEAPLKWQSFSSNEQTMLVVVSQIKKQGMFIQCSVPESINAPGVFFQKDKIVGWTFGSLLKGGYLLASTKRQIHSTSITVKGFYEATFANGREEQFAKVLATRQNYSVIDRLLAFSTGFQLEPKLSLHDTPPLLHPNAIRKQMPALVAQVVQEGVYRDLVNIFTDPVLLDFIDAKQLSAIIYSAANRYGYKNGIQLLETVSENLNPNSVGPSDLNEIHAKLYKEWIQSLLNNGDIRTGWQIFAQGKEYYPDDYEIQLLGVELALAEMDWQEAERLLNAMAFPPYLGNKLKNLYARVSDLKAQEGKIEIRFPPGYKVIPVTARLNDTVEQDFLIDTGASMVTIPTSSIDTLGIEIDEHTPRRLVSTAGGVKTASEVTLSSISLKGWAIYDVKALVLDIPGTPSLGLLGLNFLSSFQMDLDTEKGVLVLEPK